MRYRASKAGWAERLPEHWGECRLRFLGTINPTKAEAAGRDSAEEITFLPMEAVGEDGSVDTSRTRPFGDVSAGYTYFRDGDILVAKITPCFENGKAAQVEGLIGGIGFGSTEFHVIRAGKRLHSGFLRYMVRSAPFRDFGTASMYGAGGQKRVPTDFVQDYIVPIPSLPEQEAIADFLDRETKRIDALIAKQNEFLTTLHEHWHATVATAVTRGMPPHALTTEAYPLDVRHIPAGWTVQKLKTLLLRIEQGWSPQCESRPAAVDEWGVLKVGCVNGGTFREDENKALPVDVVARPALEVHAGDLLMSRANTVELVGSAALVHQTRRKLMLCDKLYRLHFDRSRTDVRFVAYCLQSEIGRRPLEAAATGASPSMKNISQEAVKEVRLAWPDFPEQQQIADELDRRRRIVERTRQTSDEIIERLVERREALITAAITGQIDVEATTRIETAA